MAVERAARGRFFLVQHVDPEQDGGRSVASASSAVSGGSTPKRARTESRVSDDTGSTRDYAYELEGGTLTIRAGETDPPAHFSGEFSDDGRTLYGK